MASFINAVKDALAKKQAAEHPGAKSAKGSTKSVKKTAAPVITGKPVKKVTGRGG